MIDTIPQFRDAIQAAGLTPPDVIEMDGKLHRFASNGKRKDDAGWYLLHGDGIPAGSFGDWRTGFSQTWRADIGRTLTHAEEGAHLAKIEAMRREREAEETKRKAGAKALAAEIWKAAQSAPANHSYLTRKGIRAHGAKLHDGKLLIPMRDGSDLHSLQYIGTDGEKRFLTGGRVAGCYFSIGGKPDRVMCIAEGFATGATIHEATGYPVAVAFNAGNLLAVAKAMRDKFPELPLILCADDDNRTEGNPGLTKATEVARSVGGLLAVPDFGSDRPEKATDFNDMAQLCGLDAVRLCIDAALNSAAMSAHAEIDEATQATEPKKGSMARELVEFVTAKAELFHSDDGDGYVTFHAGSHDETWKIDSRGFREWLCAAFFRDFEKIPSESALKDAIRALSGKARYDGKEIPVAIRCATIPDGYLIDLCNDEWKAVHVTASGWQVVNKPAVRFWRNSNMRPLPMPSRTGNLTKLWNYVNIDPDDRPMMLAFLIECFRADTPFPIAELTGGQGAAKSTTQTNLKSLIDPNAVNLRARPKTLPASRLTSSMLERLIFGGEGAGFPLRPSMTTGRNFVQLSDELGERFFMQVSSERPRQIAPRNPASRSSSPGRGSRSARESVARLELCTQQPGSVRLEADR